MAPCQVEVKIEGEIALVKLLGTLVYEDVLSACLEVAHVFAQGCRKVVVDMSQLVNVNSKGLGALISIQRQATELSAQLILLNPSPKTRELLRLTKLEQVFHIHKGTFEQAKGLFRAVVRKP